MQPPDCIGASHAAIEGYHVKGQSRSRQSKQSTFKDRVAQICSQRPGGGEGGSGGDGDADGGGGEGEAEGGGGDGDAEGGGGDCDAEGGGGRGARVKVSLPEDPESSVNV